MKAPKHTAHLADFYYHLAVVAKEFELHTEAKILMRKYSKEFLDTV